ncbi:MAG: thioredoxin [Patescibacteria group bacterium]
MENIFNDANFENEVIKSSVPVLVDFWAPWCGPCRIMSPIIEELADEMDASKIKIGKVNVDENGGLAQTYNIMSIPSFIVFKDGKVAEQFVGVIQKEAFKEKLQKYLA